MIYSGHCKAKGDEQGLKLNRIAIGDTSNF